LAAGLGIPGTEQERIASSEQFNQAILVHLEDNIAIQTLRADLPHKRFHH
jgi:hypothetical protein